MQLRAKDFFSARARLTVFHGKRLSSHREAMKCSASVSIDLPGYYTRTFHELYDKCVQRLLSENHQKFDSTNKVKTTYIVSFLIILN